MVIIGVTNIRLFYVMYVAVHPDFLYHLNAFNDIEANYTTTGSSLTLVKFLFKIRHQLIQSQLQQEFLQTT